MRAEQIFLNRATAILRPLELTFARYQVLGMLRWAGPMTLGSVGHRLWITPGDGDQRRRPARGGRPEPARVAHPTDARATLVRDHGQGTSDCSTRPSSS